MSIVQQVFSVERENGYIANCWVYPRAGDSNLIDGNNNKVTVALNGYAILPIEMLLHMFEEDDSEEYESLMAKIAKDQERLKST